MSACGDDVELIQTMVLNDGPLGFTINGKGFPGTAPIALKQGQTLRIRYMNEGLQIHPMHLHGLVQRARGGLTEPTLESDGVHAGPPATGIPA